MSCVFTTTPDANMTTLASCEGKARQHSMTACRKSHVRRILHTDTVRCSQVIGESDKVESYPIAQAYTHYDVSATAYGHVLVEGAAGLTG